MPHQCLYAMFFMVGVISALIFAVIVQRKEIWRKDALIQDFIETYSLTKSALDGIQRQLNFLPELETSIKIEIREQFASLKENVKLVIENANKS